MNILVECHHAIGDVVMTFPALTDLKKLYPGSHVTYLCGMEAERQLILGTGLVDEVVVHNVKKNTYFDLLKLAARLRMRRFDLGIAFGASPRGLDILLLKLIGVKRLVSYKNPRSAVQSYEQVDVSGIKHRCLRELAVIKHLGGAGDAAPPFIVPSEKTISAVKEKLGCGNKPLIGFVLGSGDFMYRKDGKIFLYNIKKWPSRNFDMLGKRLIDEGFRIVLIGGSAECSIAKSLEISNSPDCADLTGKCSLDETCAALLLCRMAVGADTGPMHCAAAVGTPTLTLFGPTDADEVAPLWNGSSYIYGDHDCVNCYNLCPEKGYECKAPCMESITADAVYEKLKSMGV